MTRFFILTLLTISFSLQAGEYCLEKLTRLLDPVEFHLAVKEKVEKTTLKDKQKKQLIEFLKTLKVESFDDKSLSLRFSKFIRGLVGKNTPEKELSIHVDHQQAVYDMVEWFEGLSPGQMRRLAKQVRRVYSEEKVEQDHILPAFFSIKDRQLRKFEEAQDSIKKYEQKLLAKNGGLYSNEVKEKLELYKGYKFSCRKGKSESNLNKRNHIYSLLGVPLGIAAPVAMYPAINGWHWENELWRDQYGYDIAYISVQNFLYYFAVVPFIRWKKMGDMAATVTAFAYHTGINYLAIQTVYDPLFNFDEDDVIEFIQGMDKATEADFKAEIDKVLEVARNKELVEKFQNQMLRHEDVMSKNMKSFFSDLDQLESADPELKQAFVQLIIDDIYAKQGGLIKSGDSDKGEDKFLFETALDVFWQYPDVIASVALLNMLCHTQDQGRLGLAKTLGAYFGYSMVFNSVLFGGRALFYGF